MTFSWPTMRLPISASNTRRVAATSRTASRSRSGSTNGSGVGPGSSTMISDDGISGNGTTGPLSDIPIRMPRGEGRRHGA